MAKILTQRGVEAAKPKAKRYGIPDGLVPGQRLVIEPSGFKSYRLITWVNGTQINFKIGPAVVLTLADARAKGKLLLTAIANGEDPREAKRAVGKVAAETVEVFARRFVERYAKVRNKTWRDVEQRIAREVLPRWGRRPITSIGQADVVALLDAIQDRGALRSADLTLATVRKMFNWGCERGTLTASPCDRIRTSAPVTKRDRVLADVELALGWRAAEELGYPFGPFFQLLILSLQRREEIAGLRWSELNRELTLWTLPAGRTKTGVQHQVPLTAAMRDILAGVPRLAGSDFVFTTTGATSISGYSRAKRNLDRAITRLNGGVPIPAWTVHDLRRSGATGMARLGVQLPVVEKLLNHTSGASFGGVRGVYQRHEFRDEMAEALQRWGQHVTTLIEPAPGRRPRKLALVRQGARP